MIMRKFVTFLVLVLFAASPGFAHINQQLTADQIAAKLESQLLAGSAVKMNFKVKGGEKVTITTDTKEPRVRIESGSLTIVSDGSTVWNYKKDSKQLTIDNISSGQTSALKHPQDLFRFSSNYSSRLLSSDSKGYVVEFTPNGKLKDLLKSVGEINSLTFTLASKGNALQIKKADIHGKNGVTETGALSIQTLRNAKASDFTFQSPAGAKVIDLRE